MRCTQFVTRAMRLPSLAATRARRRRRRSRARTSSSNGRQRLCSLKRKRAGVDAGWRGRAHGRVGHQPNQPTLSLPTSNAWIHHHHRCSRHQRSSAENPQISRTSPFSRMVGFLRGTVRGGGRGRAVTRARAGGGVEASSHVCARTHAERAVRA